MHSGAPYPPPPFSRRLLLNLPRAAFAALLLLAAVLPSLAHAQTVSVTAPQNGDRIVPGTPFVISASATGDGTNTGPVTGVEFFVVPNRGKTNAADLPGTTASSADFALSDSINYIHVTSPGSGYLTPPPVNFTGGGGSNAVAVAVLSNNQVASINVLNGGSGYTNQPTVQIGYAFTNATATAQVGGGGVTNLIVGDPGSGYDPASPPLVTVELPPSGTQAQANATVSNGVVTNVAVSGGGAGYFSAPDVTFDPPPAGVRAEATAVLSNGQIVSLTPTKFGSGYFGITNTLEVAFVGVTTNAPARYSAQINTNTGQITNYVSITNGSGYGTIQPIVVVPEPPAAVRAAGTAQINTNTGVVTNILITQPGLGYSSAPLVTISIPPAGTQAVFTAQVGTNSQITNFTRITAGSGYATNSPPPSVTIAPPTGGSGATAVAGFGLNTNSITNTTFVSGYPSAPPVTIPPPNLPGGTQAQGFATIDGAGDITGVTITNAGSGYTNRSIEVTMPSPRAQASVGSDALYPFLTTATLPGNDRYTLYAIASYLNGTNATNTNRPVVIGEQGTVPTVSITTPAAATTGLTADVPFEVRANATFPGPAADGDALATYELFVNGALFASATNPTFSYTPNTEGYYALVVRATTLRGLVADSAPVVVNVTQGTPPTVLITSPVAADTLTPGIPATIIADVAGNSGSITQVDFVVNGQVVGSAAAEPFIASFTPSAVGPYTIFARASDSLGNVADSASVTVNAAASSGEPPLVLLTQPLAGSRFVAGSSLYLNAKAVKLNGETDPDMALSFFINGVERPSTLSNQLTGEFALPFTISQAGTTLRMQAVATQGNGEKGASSLVNIATVGAQNTLPVVTIQSLAPGTSTIAGGTIPLRAKATLFGADPEETTVQFFADGLYLGNGALQEDGTYLFNWETSSVPNSYSSLQARVIAPNAVVTVGSGDDREEVTYFASVFSSNFLTINTSTGVPPSVEMLLPVDGSSISLGQEITIRASASGSAGVASIAVSNPGSGYTSAPTVEISAPATEDGIQATAVAVLGTGPTAGQVVRVDVTNTGSGYTGAPMVSFAGGGGANASAVAQVLTPTVASVQYYINGAPLGEPITQQPYQTVFTPTSQGSYLISAVAITTDGLVSAPDSVVTVVSSGDAPTVDITSPRDGQSFLPGASVVAVADAEAFGDARVQSVQFFVNGVSVDEPDTTAPFTTILSLPGAGNYSIVALVTDSFGNVGSDSISITGAQPTGNEPIVTMTEPVGRQRYVYGSRFFLNIFARPASESAPIAPDTVRIFANGVALPAGVAPSDIYSRLGDYYSVPYAASSQSPTVAIIGTASNEEGETSLTDPLNLEFVQARKPFPQVEMLPLAPGSPTPAGGFITLRARAQFPTSEDEDENSVEFFVNGVFVGAGLPTENDPNLYILNWRSPSLPVEASYKVQARAITVNVPVPGPVDFSYRASIISENFITVSTEGAELPTTSISSPATGSSVALGQPFSIQASASADGTTINRVEFYVNGDFLESSTQAPYTVQYTPPSTGRYRLVAVAITETGLGGQSEEVVVSVTQGQPPTVSITSPVNGNTIPAGQPVTITANSSDPDGSVVSVTFYQNGTQIGQPDTEAPYIASFTPASPGQYSLFAVAQDNSGNITQSTPPVVVTVPSTVVTATMVAPANNSSFTLGTPVILTATAGTTAGATITSVRFEVNSQPVGTQITTAPYASSFVPTALGNYSVRAIATDSSGNTGVSDPITFTVKNPVGSPPLIWLSQPSQGNYVTSGGSLFLNFTTFDTEGKIDPTTLRIFVNGVALTDPAPQRIGLAGNTFGVLWTPGVVGNYIVTAQISDLDGNTASSGVSTFIVLSSQQTVPQVTIEPYTIDSQYVAVDVPIVLRARAKFFANTDPAVEFYANGVFVGTATAGASNTDGSVSYSLVWTPDVAGSPVALSARAVGINFTQTEFTTDPDGDIIIVERNVYVSAVSSNRPTPPVTDLTIHEIPSNPIPGSNDAFVVEAYNKLLYGQPVYSEWRWYTDQLASGAMDRADVVMQLMGFDAPGKIFNQDTEYALTSAQAFAPFARLGLVPTELDIDSFLRTLEAGNESLLPLTGTYSGIANAPYGATFAMAQSLQGVFNSNSFRNRYPPVTGFTNRNFVYTFLAQVMFPGRYIGPESQANQVVDMMDSFAPQSDRQGAAAAFLTRYFLTVMSDRTLNLQPQGLATRSVEEAFQRKLNTAALQFQWNSSASTAVRAKWFGPGFASAPDYSKGTVQKIIDPGYVRPLRAQTVAINGADIIEFRKGRKITLSATTSSGRPPTFTSSNPSVLSISGRTATIRRTGKVRVTASVSGNGSYNPGKASKVYQIVAPRRTQSISRFSPKTNITRRTVTSFTLSSRATSGLAVTYASSNPAIISIVGNRATVHRPGTVKITASQAGNTRFRPAASVRRNVRVW